MALEDNMENKEMKTEELKEVSGGQKEDNGLANCPNCGFVCEPGKDVVTESSGCSEDAYWLCPKCGYRWR